MSGEKQVAASGLSAGGSIIIGEIHQVINSSNAAHQRILEGYRSKIRRLERDCLSRSKSNQLDLQQQIQRLSRKCSKEFEEASKQFESLRDMHSAGLEASAKKREEEQNTWRARKLREAREKRGSSFMESLFSGLADLYHEVGEPAAAMINLMEPARRVNEAESDIDEIEHILRSVTAYVNLRAFSLDVDQAISELSLDGLSDELKEDIWEIKKEFKDRQEYLKGFYEDELRRYKTEAEEEMERKKG